MIRQQSGEVGVHARQRDHVSCRKSAALCRRGRIPLDDGVAAALVTFSKATMFPACASSVATPLT